MGDKYAASGHTALPAGAGDTLLTMHQPAAASGVRARLYEFICAVGGTPADNVIDWFLQYTVDVTVGAEGAGVVPDPIDDGAPDPGRIDAGEDYGAEPAYTKTYMDFYLNARATFRWVAAPGGGIVLPNAADDGIGIIPVHATATDDAKATFHWEE